MRIALSFLAAALIAPFVVSASPTTTDTSRAILPSFLAGGTDLVRLQSAAFDPLADAAPAPHGWSPVDEADLPPTQRQVWLVQVADGQFAQAHAAIETAGAQVIGAIPDGVLVVGATPAQRGAIAAAGAVRWTGMLQPAWKVPVTTVGHRSPLEIEGDVALTVLSWRADPEAGTALDAVDAIPGVQVMSRSEAVATVRTTSDRIAAIAAVTGVAWIELEGPLQLHNANARWVSDTGVRDLHVVTAPDRLDGAGQVAAVADTGVNYAPDINGRSHEAFSECDPVFGSEPVPASPGGGETPAPSESTVASWTFDSDLEGWQVSQEGLSVAGVGDWEYQSSEGQPVGSAGIAPYTDSLVSVMITPEPVAVPSGTRLEFDFDARVSTEGGFDPLAVAYRVDGGAWQVVYTELGSGTAAEWGSHTFELDAHVGSQVELRFTLESDDNVSGPAFGDGVFVDNVALRGVPDGDNLPAPDVIDPSEGRAGQCKLADFTQATPGSDAGVVADVVSQRALDGRALHRKMAGYFDIGVTGRSPRDDSAHGTHVAGSVTGDVGANGVWDGHDGMAPAARLVFQAIGTSSGGLATPTDIYDLFAQAYRPRDPASVPRTWDPLDYIEYDPLTDARTHNNSWGAALPADTGAGRSFALDEFVWDHEDMLISFSAGNGGPGVGTIGSPSIAKNNISSAASDNGRQLMSSIGTLAHFSSHGPTADGRWGPDVATPGQIVISPKGGRDRGDHYLQGTSMSSPVLTGLATLVRQYFCDGFGPSNGAGFARGSVLSPTASTGECVHNPSAALVKATLINGADRMRGTYTGDDGQVVQAEGQWPSHGQGHGLVNLDDSLYFEGSRTNAWFQDVWRDDDNAFAETAGGVTTREYTLEVQGGAPLDVSLAWTDAPTGTPAGTPALINNLDLEVEAPDGTVYVGNNMNTRSDPSAEVGETLAAPGPFDARNNSERVTVADPAAGDWTVRVIARAVVMGPQGFAVAAAGNIDPVDTESKTDDFTPGPPLQEDIAGAPLIVDVAVEPHSADTTRITFRTSEPTTAYAEVEIDGETRRFDDLYSVSPDSDFVAYFQATPSAVETSPDYADVPVTSTHHELLVYGTSPGADYTARLVATDLADNDGSAMATWETPDDAFQAFAADQANVLSADTDILPSDLVGAAGWGTGTQFYVGYSSGTEAVSALMYRLPESVDPSRITSAALEFRGGHDLASLYDADPRILVDLLAEVVEDDWGGQTVPELNAMEAVARAAPEGTGHPLAGERTLYSLTCADLNQLISTLETVQDGERRAAFRLTSADPGVATSLPSWEFGFNRRSFGAELRPRLLLEFDNGTGGHLPTPCDPDLPAPTISDVGVADGATEGSAIVAWQTDLPSDSTVIYREQGTTDWIQVRSSELTTDHEVQVLGLDRDEHYEFGVRSAVCNGRGTTADNDGAGWDFFYPETPEAVYYFGGNPGDEAAKLAGAPTATFTTEEPTSPVAIQQKASLFANAEQQENLLSAFWKGPLSGQIIDSLTLEWWWSSDSSNAALGQAVNVRIWADPGTDDERLIVSEQAGLSLGATPVRNVVTFDVDATVVSELLIQAAPNFLGPLPIVHYGSATEPSGFRFFVEEPPDIPAAGPVPPLSAAAAGLNMASIPSHTGPFDADVSAGTMQTSTAAAGFEGQDPSPGGGDGSSGPTPTTGGGAILLGGLLAGSAFMARRRFQLVPSGRPPQPRGRPHGTSGTSRRISVCVRLGPTDTQVIGASEFSSRKST